MNEISEKILKLRRECGYSQDDLARRVGVVRQTISRWEAGAALPGTVELMSLCNALGVDMDYFRPDNVDSYFFATAGGAAENHGVAGSLSGCRRSAAPYMCGVILFTLCIGVISVIAIYIGVALYTFRPDWEWELMPPLFSYKCWLFVCIILWFANVAADGMCVFMTVKTFKGN